MHALHCILCCSTRQLGVMQSTRQLGVMQSTRQLGDECIVRHQHTLILRSALFCFATTTEPTSFFFCASTSTTATSKSRPTNCSCISCVVIK